MPPAKSITTKRNTMTLDQLNMRYHSVLLCLPIPKLRRMSASKMPIVGSGPEAPDYVKHHASEGERERDRNSVNLRGA